MCVSLRDFRATRAGELVSNRNVLPSCQDSPEHVET